MYPVKQSTALVVPFFAHDANGDAVTGLTDGSFTKRISKNGAAFAAMTVTITELENGWYSFPLSSGHSDTLGLLTILFTNAGAKQVNLQFRVSVRIPDDLAFPATSGRSLQVETDGMVHGDLKEWLGAAPNALVSSRVDSSVGAMAANVLTAAAINAAAFTSAKFAAGALSASAFAQGAADKVWASSTRTLTALSTALALSIWDVLESAVLTASSMGVKLKTNLDALISTRATPAQVATELGTYDGPTNAEMAARTLAAAAYFDPAVDTVDVGKINGSASAAAQLAKSSIGIVSGAAIAGTLSTTQMTTNLTETTDEHYTNRVILWTSGNLAGQLSDVTAYTGATKLLTFTAVTEAPVATDKFVLL